jgi:hypothetical protein
MKDLNMNLLFLLFGVKPLDLALKFENFLSFSRPEREPGL